MATILWWALVFILLSLGLLGCFVNKIPGPIAVFFATLVAMLALDVTIEWYVLTIVGVLAIASIVASKFLVKLVKKLHEYSRRASVGTTIASLLGLGLIAGCGQVKSATIVMVVAIIALIGLPFLFAFIFELTNRKGANNALKAACSATLAYLADTCLKLVVFVYAIYAIFEL